MASLTRDSNQFHFSSPSDSRRPARPKFVNLMQRQKKTGKELVAGGAVELEGRQGGGQGMTRGYGTERAWVVVECSGF